MDYYIDNYNFKGFGIYVQESTGVVDLPKFKPPTETDWAEYHGVIVDSEKTPRTEARTIQLKCFLKAENQVDFLTKLSAFQSVFMTKGLKRLAIILTNEVGLFFDVYMSDGLQVTKRWSDSTMVGQFTVNLCEPEPIKKIIRFDSQGSASTLSFKTSEAVSIYWGDGTVQQDLYGNVSLSHTYDESGIYFAIIHGNIDNITDLTTSGDVLTTNNGGNIEIEIPEILNGALESVELFNVAEPGISQLTPYIRFAFNNNSGTRYLRITIDANDEWLEQITIINNRLNEITADITSLQSNKADKNQLTQLQQSIATNATNIANNTSAITSINNKIGEPNGIAELDTNGKVPQSQLPSFVDDVVEYASLSNFPPTGESGKIYIATDTNITYRWGGSTYVPIGSDLALGETASTAYRGDRGKTAYDHSQTQGNPHNTTIAQISGLQDALNGKQPTIGKNEYLKQVSDLDNYNAIDGEIVEYIGATTSDFVNNYFYKKVVEHNRGDLYLHVATNHNIKRYDGSTVQSDFYSLKIGDYFSNSGATPIATLIKNAVYSLNSANYNVIFISNDEQSMSDVAVGDWVLLNNSERNLSIDIFDWINDGSFYIAQLTEITSDGFGNINSFKIGTNSFTWVSRYGRITHYGNSIPVDIYGVQTNVFYDDNNNAALVFAPMENGKFAPVMIFETMSVLQTPIMGYKQIDVQPRFSGSYNDLSNKPLSVENSKVKYTLSDGTTKLTLAQESDLKTVAFTGKSIDCYDLKIEVPDYKCCLIADIDDFYRSPSSTTNLPFQGFVGRLLKTRGGGNIAEASAEVSCCVSYKNTDTEYHFTISSTHFDINPCIVLYNNKYYLCIDINMKKTNNRIFLYGYFENCLNTPLIVDSSDCTIVRNWNYSIKNATRTSDGLMSAADKSKVDTIGIVYRGQLQHNLSVMTSGLNLIHVHCQDFKNDNCCLDCYVAAKGTTGSSSTFTWHYAYTIYDRTKLEIVCNYNGVINVINNTGRPDSDFVLFIDKLI